MITSKDVREEIKIARKVVEDENSTTQEQLKAVLKLVEVDIKVGLSTRVSLVRVMEHLKVEKIQPRRRENAEKKPEETTK